MDNNLQNNKWGFLTSLKSTFILAIILFQLLGANAVSAQASSVDLSGPSDYINLGSALTNATNFTTSSVFTMETWVKLNSVAGYNTIFANRPSGGSERGYAFFIYDGKPYFEAYASGSISPTAIEADVWTHVAVVFNNGTCSFYINGEFVHSSSGVNIYSRSSTSALLGTLTNGWAGFNGSIDEFKVWNVARTQDEIATDMSHNTMCNDNGLLAYFPFNESAGTAVSSTVGGYVGQLLSGAIWASGVVTTECLPLQTLTILGGNGQPGDIDPYIEASRDNGATWQPAYLSGWHPWGFVDGTNSWINFDPSPFVGLNEETDYRIRFYIPEEFSDPRMTFTIKADNYAWLSINGRVLDYITGQASNAPDLSIDQDLVPGLNEITVRLKDTGGWVGLNYRIDITMYANEAPTFEPSRFLNTAPIANAGEDKTIDCALLTGSEVTLNGSGTDADNDQLTYSWSENGSVVSTSASFSSTFAPGTHTLTLTVDDGKGGVATDNVTVTINADVTAPVADAESLVTVTGECSAAIETAPTATDACEGTIVGTTEDALEYTAQGTYTVTWTFTDANGNSSEQTQSVVVNDVTAPTVISDTQLVTLWSPNHKYETVSLSDFGVSISDNCADVSSSALLITKVTSDEAEDSKGNGDGNTKDDIVIADDFKSVDLRKERDGKGNGRVYTIYASISDGNGNISDVEFYVQVPHDKNDTAVKDDDQYSVLGGIVEAGGVLAEVSENGANISTVESVTENKSSVNNAAEALPEGYELSQNYPNPFNPSTTISFAIPEAGYYSLRVYNTLGQVIAELVNGQIQSGYYNYSFDASKLTSGMYIYSLQGNNVNISKKMILMK